MQTLLKTILGAGLALALAGPLAAHEFWIWPERYQLAPQDPLRASLRVGQQFEGAEQSYLPPNILRFDLVTPTGTALVDGRPGDRPALAMPAPAAGLTVVVHQTRNFSLTYTDWQKFVDFLRHKDAEWVLDRHAALGLSQDRVKEIYGRYAKALIAVGDGQGADAPQGLEVEIVALDNPYTAPLAGGMAVQVLYQAAPRANAQVELFERAPDGRVAVTLHRTDAQGVVRLPVKAGHEYLVDSVVLRETPQALADTGAQWESLWASLTFRVPE